MWLDKQFSSLSFLASSPSSPFVSSSGPSNLPSSLVNDEFKEYLEDISVGSFEENDWATPIIQQLHRMGINVRSCSNFVIYMHSQFVKPK